MHRLYVAQRLMTVREKFDVQDERGTPVYYIEGSLFKIPKQFWIRDLEGRDRARVWKEPLSLMPRFTLEVDGVRVAVIRQKVSLMRKRFEIEGPGLTVRGNWWDMSFELLRNGVPVGRVDKKWMTIRDRYTIEIDDPASEVLMLAVVLSVDYVKRIEASTAAATSS